MSPSLRIVIVSWNVESLLERCLASLPHACQGLTWDVVVVDNASRDTSVEVAKKYGATVISNQDNRGFARACNQGLVGSDAEFVLLLNPDTECPPGSLVELVASATEHPNVGIIGPKLLNPDGSVQASIRRFPEVWTQAGIMLKLHHLFPGLFRRYFASDLSLEKEQDVDQVMGACFLIRRELIDQLGGLDERYFIWFEEVDYCKQAINHGWKVRYIPRVSVTHHGGQSFGQVFSLKKQMYFNQSLVQYFSKWHAAWQGWLLWMLLPVSLMFASVVGGLKSGKAEEQETSFIAAVCGWSFVVIGLELTSALTIFRDTPNAVAALLIGAVMAWLAYKRPTLALSAFFLELLIGSKGALLQVWGWPGAFSLRIVLFVSVMLGWALSLLREKGIVKIVSYLWSLFRGRLEWLLLLAFVVYGVLRGLTLQNGPVLADANAWGFLLLLLPTLDLLQRYKSRLLADVLPVLVVGPVWLALKTLGLEYLFSHGFKSVATGVYLWVRRTGVGEVTLVTGNAFRIFMQSYVFALPALLFGAAYHFTTQERAFTRKLLPRITSILFLAAMVVLLISLSRSLWIGATIGMLTLIVLCAKMLFHDAARSLVVAIRLGIMSACALMMVIVTLAFPFPPVDVASLSTLFGSRASTSDAAAASRWNLLPAVMTKIKQHPLMGSGFGATVTYKTQDPRILAQNPSGLYTTYAFEWGWLEHWVKFGVFGFILMFVLVGRLAWRIWHSPQEAWIRYAGVASIVALAATHVFTPYLNHPLGFGYLLMLEMLTIGEKKKT